MIRHDCLCRYMCLLEAGLGISSSIIIHLNFERGSLTDIGDCSSSEVGRIRPQIYLPTPLKPRVMVVYYHECWGPEPRSSCLHSKHLTHWAISPVLRWGF